MHVMWRHSAPIDTPKHQEPPCRCAVRVLVYGSVADTGLSTDNRKLAHLDLTNASMGWFHM
jgi:hypothetical protein